MGMINHEDIADILRDSLNEEKYLGNSILRMLLHGRGDVAVEENKEMVSEYGRKLEEDDEYGKMIYQRMIDILDRKEREIQEKPEAYSRIYSHRYMRKEYENRRESEMELFVAEKKDEEDEEEE